jgi:MATE family multidrug resistance protein
MGWLGPQALAAGALGTNLYFALLIFGIGLVTATSPLVAREIGRNRHSVREVHRTVRQGLWAALVVAIPISAFAWQADTILRAMGAAGLGVVSLLMLHRWVNRERLGLVRSAGAFTQA